MPTLRPFQGRGLRINIEYFECLAEQLVPCLSFKIFSEKLQGWTETPDEAIGLMLDQKGVTEPGDRQHCHLKEIPHSWKTKVSHL